MKEIIKSTRRRIVFYYLSTLLLFPNAYNFGMMIIGYRDHLVFYEGEKIVIMFGDFYQVLTIIGTTVWLYGFINHLKGTSKKIIRKPYRVELGMYSKDEICSLLNNKLEFKTVAEDCIYASESTGKYDWRTFVFLFDENNPADGIDIAAQYVKDVNKSTGFKPARRINTFTLTSRIQIFIYDSVPKTVLDSIQDSVYFDIIHFDILTNFIIDLSEGVLYIPLLLTRTDVTLTQSPQLKAIEKVGKYLDLI